MADKEIGVGYIKTDKCHTINLLPRDIWIEFNTISVGVGKNKKTFDLVKIFEGLEKLAEKGLE